MSPKSQIITLDGGGFGHDPDDLSLDHYILDQAAKERPTICFLATASGDAESYRYSYYASFARLECQPTHLPLFEPPTADLESFIYDQDIIYVGGGNTKSLLALWREWEMGAAAYELTLREGIVQETKLEPTIFLGQDD